MHTLRSNKKEILFFLLSFSFFLFSLALTVSATAEEQPEEVIEESVVEEVVEVEDEIIEEESSEDSVDTADQSTEESIDEDDEETEKTQEEPEALVTVSTVNVACDPEVDISGSIVDGTKTEIMNTSDSCSYDVGLASYEKIDEVFDNQTIVDDADPDPEPPVDQCLPPFEANDEEFIPGASSEKTLQDILDDAGFSLDVEIDQKDTETWNPNNGQTTNVEVELIDGVATHDHVFGYYTDGDTDTFTPLFEVGDHSGFSGIPVFSDGDVASAIVPAVSKIGFAIAVETTDGDKYVVSTDTATNGGDDNAAVYLPLSGGFIIAFEDRHIASSDRDFNDLVVYVQTTDCEDVDEPEEPQQCIEPEFTSSTTIDVKVGDFVSYTLTASSTTDLTFDVATSTLPEGLTFDGVDTISGTTTTEGSFVIDILVSNTCEEIDVDLTINVTDDNNGGGGGGSDDDDDDDNGNSGGGSGSSGGRIFRGGQGGGEVLGATAGLCEPLITEYLRFGYDNNETQVRLLQAFLQGVEGYDVDVTGFFDEKTDVAVRDFQLKYASDILEPWGLTAPTGYVYYTTQKKINEIYCDRSFPLSAAQAEQIESCRAMLLDELYGTGGGGVAGESEVLSDSDPSGSGKIGTATSTALQLALEDESSDDDTQGISIVDATEERIRAIAATAFTFPNTPRDLISYGLWLVLILALVYIFGSLLAGIKDSHMDVAQTRMRKIIYFMVGTLIGLVVVVMMKLTALIVPLIVVLIVLSIGLLYYSRKKTA